MDLGTFGAILSFSIDLEQQATEFYEAVACQDAASTSGGLAHGSAERRRRLLRARQELVSEMILESITGLEGDAYTVDLDPRAGDADVFAQALALESTAARYYRDAAAKMPIREVVRLFLRLAQENDRRHAIIYAHGQSCGM